MIGKAVDISSGGGYPGDLLSSFTPYKFTFRGREFCSMESLLQGMKFECVEKQDKIFNLVGRDAKRKGKKRKWFLDQNLYWQGTPMKRDSAEYKAIVKEAFDDLAQNTDFQQALLATGDKTLYHTMGKSDPTRTILTEQEFCELLTNIRTRLAQYKKEGDEYLITELQINSKKDEFKLKNVDAAVATFYGLLVSEYGGYSSPYWRAAF